MVLVCATPVLGMALLLIAVDHAFRWGIFNPQFGAAIGSCSSTCSGSIRIRRSTS